MKLAKSPIVEMRHFREKYFSMALISNTTFHFSMLATMTLVPIVVEEGFGQDPIVVPFVLLPNQVMGVFVSMVAGWVYDRYNPKLLRPTAMLMIAGGFLVMGLFAPSVELWMIPILMIPISVGSSIFNPINNATVMSSLPLRHRGIASGMLETTREMGHAFGGTVSATALAMVLPAGIAHLTSEQASAHYFEGFVFSCLPGGVRDGGRRTGRVLPQGGEGGPAAAGAGQLRVGGSGRLDMLPTQKARLGSGSCMANVV